MPENRRTTFVLIVEDHPLVADSLAACVRACDAEAEVTTVESLRAALESLSWRPAPALIITDLTLTDSNGIETLRQLRAAAPTSSLLVFTALDDTALADQALALGAIGYLVKSSSTDALRQAIQSVIGRAEVRPALVSARDHELEGLLTQKQIAVLEELAAGRSNKEIALRLGISDQTVGSHMKEILGRFGVRNRTEAVVRYLDLRRRQAPARHGD